MIRTQLFRHGMIRVEEKHPDPTSANRHIDALINELHKGVHGTGEFQIHADHVNEHDLFTGLFYETPTFFHPCKETKLRKPA